jgi:hypothetical protein
LEGRALVASINMNNPDWNAPDLQRRLNERRGYVYLVVDRNPSASNRAKQVLKVGKLSYSGWRSRLEDYRTWALEGKFWANGVQESGWQLTVYVFAVPNGQQGNIERAVRRALYDATGDAHQDLPRDYSDSTQDGRWEDFNTRPTGAGVSSSPRSPISNLNLTSLFSGTAFASVADTARTVDLNYEANYGGQGSFNGMQGHNWVYLLEWRNPRSEDLNVLKVGETINPQRRSGPYRTMAKYEMSMAMVLFEVTDAFIQQLRLPDDLQQRMNDANALTNTTQRDNARRRVVEDALRRALYDEKGKQLPLDHSQGPWRTRSGDWLRNDRNNTVASTLTTPSWGNWA